MPRLQSNQIIISSLYQYYIIIAIQVYCLCVKWKSHGIVFCNEKIFFETSNKNFRSFEFDKQEIHIHLAGIGIAHKIKWQNKATVKKSAFYHWMEGMWCYMSRTYHWVNIYEL